MDATYLQRFLSESAAGATRNEIRELLKLIARPDILSLAGGMPSPAAFPIDELVRLLPDALEKYGTLALQYGPTEGDLGLRRELIGLMLQLEGDAFGDIAPENILVTSASQQGLDLCARVFIRPGDVVVCGLPSYLGALGAFTACGARLSGVPLDDEGMRTDLLEQRLVKLRREGIRPKFIYSVPDFQNPAGVTLTMPRRRELLAIAREFDLLVVEDSPYRQLRYVGTTPPSLHALDRDGRVISLFTFSKIFSPGLRLGWIVADEEIISRFVTAKQPVDLCTSGLSQLVVREYLRSGRLLAQIDRTNQLYSEKRDAMFAALDQYMDPAWGVSWTRPEGGLFLWVTLPEGMDAKLLMERSLAAKVAYVSGAAFHCDGSGANTLRLNFSFPTVEQIGVAISRLADCIAAERETLPRDVKAQAVGRTDPTLLVDGDHALEHLALNLALHEVVE